MKFYEEEERKLPKKKNLKQKKRKNATRHPWLALLLMLVLLLFLLSCYMLGSHLYRMATREQYVVNMMADEHSQIGLFQMEYSGDTGEITVSGINGSKDVVAPGTENEYILRLKNEDNIDIRYVLTIEQDFFTTSKVPLEVKLSDEYGNYLLGSEYEWVDIQEVNDLVYKGRIRVGEFQSLFFSWRWKFEGNDTYDTYLGNLEDEVTAGVNVAFLLDSTSDAQQAMSESVVLSHGHSWGCCSCCYLVWMLLLAIVLLVLYILFTHRKLRKYEKETEKK